MTATKRILIIDDDPEIRRILQARLRGNGLDVIESGDGSEGLAAMNRERFDAILLDIQMPVQDGLAVLRERDATLNSDTPLFVLTSLINDVATEKVRDLGIARDHILYKGQQSAKQVVERVRGAVLRQ